MNNSTDSFIDQLAESFLCILGAVLFPFLVLLLLASAVVAVRFWLHLLSLYLAL